MSSRRDWDKLKRQEKGRPDYDPIASFRPPITRRKTHRRRHHACLKMSKAERAAAKPVVERLLTIEASQPLFSRWRRRQGKWRCIWADPGIEWFVRVRHPEVIHQWLQRQEFSYQWSACTARKEQAEDRPVEPEKASAAQADHTTASLKNNHPVVLRSQVDQTTPGPERDGVTSPHRLIATERTVEPKAEHRC